MYIKEIAGNGMMEGRMLSYSSFAQCLKVSWGSDVLKRENLICLHVKEFLFYREDKQMIKIKSHDMKYDLDVMDYI